ncbi:MAG TPA: transketolase [Acidimicrobiia bacterium]|nr:transketolase [Acidimicrobiia bacterium]
MSEHTATEELAVAVIKGLAMDAVQQANSGHPGMPMGMADIAVTLWSRYIKVDPEHPDWENRDRFIVSNGHGSMLLYALLHLSGFPLPMEEVKRFRQWGSHTAGHPEVDHRLGIEMTTGPLGQGFGTGVGMAIAEAHLRARLGEVLVDHRTFGFVSDGDLMEGISAESSSLAGHLGLGRLIYFYDDNDISIDGATDITFTEDVARRFDAVGWHVVDVDGHDREAIAQATDEALEMGDRPSLVICRTHIASGAPNAQDTAKAHGSPLGVEEIRATKEAIELPVDEQFYAPDEVYEFFSEAMDRGRKARAEWEKRRVATDGEATKLWNALYGAHEIELQGPGYEIGRSVATRNVNKDLFREIADKVPGFIGGAADLVESTKTEIDAKHPFTASHPAGRDIKYGVREHAMATVTNGLAVHGGLRPYGATFFVFSDYMRPAVRLSALMSAPSIWVWTHDSIFLGEDGPTHQPIEHLASLRAMPNLWVIRPADATETVEAWEVALNRHDGPVAIVQTRQGVPVLDRPRGGVAKGGYVLREGADVVLVATGSEVHVALDAADRLGQAQISARVVSLPCWELFFSQDGLYRSEVLGEGMPRISIEAASTFGWERIVGTDGLTIGVHHFGASAPWERIAEEWGFTAEAVADRVGEWLASR